jgi:hypothetical protein
MYVLNEPIQFQGGKWDVLGPKEVGQWKATRSHVESEELEEAGQVSRWFGKSCSANAR